MKLRIEFEDGIKAWECFQEFTWMGTGNRSHQRERHKMWILKTHDGLEHAVGENWKEAVDRINTVAENYGGRLLQKAPCKIGWVNAGHTIPEPHITI